MAVESGSGTPSTKSTGTWRWPVSAASRASPTTTAYASLAYGRRFSSSTQRTRSEKGEMWR